MALSMVGKAEKTGKTSWKTWEMMDILLFNPLSASVALISIWGQHWHLMG